MLVVSMAPPDSLADVASPITVLYPRHTMGLVAVPAAENVSEAPRLYVPSALMLIRSPAAAAAIASLSVHGDPDVPDPPPPARLLTYRSVIAMVYRASSARTQGFAIVAAAPLNWLTVPPSRNDLSS